MTKPRITKQQLEQELSKGKKSKEIALEYGVSDERIYQLRRRFGLQEKPRLKQKLQYEIIPKKLIPFDLVVCDSVRMWCEALGARKEFVITGIYDHIVKVEYKGIPDSFTKVEYGIGAMKKVIC